jgi:proline racemase
MITLKTIDAHAAGEPLRLIVSGFPSPHGKTMLAKREWVRTHADHLRRALMLEPRGHADMYGAILTEPVSPGSHAGVLFMHNEGYSTMCGHGVIAVTTMALERGLLMPGGDGTSIVYDAPAGTIRAKAKLNGSRVESVSFVNVPSFVLHGGMIVKLASRTIRADVAFVAPSTRSSTAKRWVCRSTPGTCLNCAASAWRSNVPSRLRMSSCTRWMPG